MAPASPQKAHSKETKESSQAFVWLEKAFPKREPSLLMYLKTSPAFDPLRYGVKIVEGQGADYFLELAKAMPSFSMVTVSSSCWSWSRWSSLVTVAEAIGLLA